MTNKLRLPKLECKKMRLPKIKVGVTTGDRNRWKRDVGWYHKKISKPNWGLGKI